MQAFDFSDTLAKVDWNSGNIVNAIRNAKPLYKPTGQFVVITAQRDNNSIHNAVNEWLRKQYPATYKRTFFVAGSETNIINSKIRILREQKLTSFTDNNETILKAIKNALPNITLYKVIGDNRELYS